MITDPRRQRNILIAMCTALIAVVASVSALNVLYLVVRGPRPSDAIAEDALDSEGRVLEPAAAS